jgi:hypothetical protein
VRLQRDAEGNFGYVYTADSAAVNDAEQNVADKENALYNLGLQGANDYAQKYIEIERASGEAIRELTEMWMSGDIATEEEYRRRKDELQQYYYEQLQQYSSLYQTALTTDSAVVRDAWTTDFNDMIYKTDEWKTSVETYFTEAEVQMTAWKDVCNTVLEESGLDDMEAAVGDISTRSAELA